MSSRLGFIRVKDGIVHLGMVRPSKGPAPQSGLLGQSGCHALCIAAGGE